MLRNKITINYSIQQLLEKLTDLESRMNSSELYPEWVKWRHGLYYESLTLLLR